MVIFILIIGHIYIKDISGLVAATSVDSYDGSKAVAILSPHNQVFVVGIDLIHDLLIFPIGLFISGTFRLIYIKGVSDLFTDASVEAYKVSNEVSLLAPHDHSIVVVIYLLHDFLIGPTGLFVSGTSRII